jgi:hypothetical protein
VVRTDVHIQAHLPIVITLGKAKSLFCRDAIVVAVDR